MRQQYEEVKEPVIEELLAASKLMKWRFAAEAISYRIPKVVRKFIQFHDGNGYPICPRCTSSMEREYMSYCDRCGQRLCWRYLEQAEICFPPIRK